ncbi:BlaI/MecI/CopY family transcriptional regulator [Pedobacter ginsengisoli]|jgi:BlaI family transcriptional regulator, penicillinase repressor|uniref:BlaI/MecI/CopY family transcriptional regulator n=1 Tax=Pedobacter ginsengisoli TaxID=363852 RepID=UPI0025510133|nr:BlaI/MecI/CopY family transcriptional regulator [Pedobacter ginsengisoli]
MEPKIEPSKAELDILTVIWKHGPNTVRFVHNQLSLIKEVNYTTTLKQMQLMAEKGLLTRDESSMTHIYSAAEEPSKTKSHLLDRFVNHIYDGSAGNLVMQLLDNKNASSEDLKIIRDILNKLDQQK